MTELSLAIAVKGPWDASDLQRALAAAGAMSPRIDIHLACDCAPDGPLGGINIVVREGLSLFQLWGIAAAQCRAHAIAILHGHAPPAPGWAAAMLSALGSGQPLCGPVEPDYPPSDPRITGYLVEYCQFHRPLAAGMGEVPGNNLVLARSLLPSSEILERDGFSKTLMLATGTIRPTWLTDAIVEHRRPFALLPFCRRRYRHGRSYGAARLTQANAPPRLILLGATGLLPLVRVARIVRHAWRHTALRFAVLRRLPAILLAETCWSAGEFVGTLTRRPGDPALLD